PAYFACLPISLPPTSPTLFPYTTLFRSIVLTLQRLGYLTLDAGTREYSLGLKVYGLGRGLMKSFSLPERALRPMQRLVQVTRCTDRKSTRLNSSHQIISYAVFCLKKKQT